MVPRDSVVSDGEQAYVMVQRGGRFERQDVVLGAASTYQAVVTSGLQEGVTIARNAAAAAEKPR